MGKVLLSAPIAFVAFTLLVTGLHWFGGRIAAKGDDTPGKYQPYASGEDLVPQETQLAYHSFFHLALLFSLLHLATLVISTVPPNRPAQRPALLYLMAIAISVYVLTQGEIDV
jgi:NADH:ubiquinone oxidoreductase subunit 3 (subunit A)